MSFFIAHLSDLGLMFTGGFVGWWLRIMHSRIFK
jgi:hypothetical protein